MTQLILLFILYYIYAWHVDDTSFMEVTMFFYWFFITSLFSFLFLLTDLA